MKKAQLTVEVILLLSVVFLFFVGMSSITVNNMKQERLNQQSMEAKNVEKVLNGEINNAAKVYGNYSRKFQLPKTILGSDYEMNIKDENLIVLTINNETYYLWLNSKVDGQPIKGNNSIIKENNNLCLNKNCD